MTYDYGAVAKEAVEVEDEKAQQKLYDEYVEKGYDRQEILRAVRELSLKLNNIRMNGFANCAPVRPLKLKVLNDEYKRDEKGQFAETGSGGGKKDNPPKGKTLKEKMADLSGNDLHDIVSIRKSADKETWQAAIAEWDRRKKFGTKTGKPIPKEHRYSWEF